MNGTKYLNNNRDAQMILITVAKETHCKANCSKSKYSDSWTLWRFCNIQSGTKTYKAKPIHFQTEGLIYWKLIKQKKLIGMQHWMEMPPTCWDPTAKNADFIKRSIGVNFGETANMNNSVFTKSGGANKMVDGLSIDREPWLPITDHHTPISVYP